MAKGERVMLTQPELLKRLAEFGEPTTAQTLRTREKLGLVSPAYRGGAGRPGRSVFYPDRVLWENYAASKMLNSSKMRITAKEVVEARSLALQLEMDPQSIVARFADKSEEDKLPLRFACIWHGLVVYAWLDCPESVLHEVSFNDAYFYFLAKNPEVTYPRCIIDVNPQTRVFRQVVAVVHKEWRKTEELVDLDALF